MFVFDKKYFYIEMVVIIIIIIVLASDFKNVDNLNKN